MQHGQGLYCLHQIYISLCQCLGPEFALQASPAQLSARHQIGVSRGEGKLSDKVPIWRVEGEKRGVYIVICRHLADVVVIQWRSLLGPSLLSWTR